MKTAEAPQLSVVIPVLNDARALERLLGELDLAGADAVSGPVEVVVVDGGSDDDPTDPVARHAARLVRSKPGRGHQLAAGVAASTAPWLWFLHADSSAVHEPLSYLLALGSGAQAPGWGWFDLAFEPRDRRLDLVAFMMRHRSRLSGICTGDQGMYVHRDLLERAGGVPQQRLMEDIELSRRLKRLVRPRVRPETLCTSSRRWGRRGVLRTIVSMWRFRLRYWLGADADDLAREYYR